MNGYSAQSCGYFICNHKCGIQNKVDQTKIDEFKWRKQDEQTADDYPQRQANVWV